MTVADPGVRLLLADGLTAEDVTVALELPEQYLLGAEPGGVCGVYTVNGGAKQESTSVRVEAEITGLAELLEQSTGKSWKPPRTVEPKPAHGCWRASRWVHRRRQRHGDPCGAAAACPAEKAPQNGKAP